jgi:dihydropyrimidinase
VLDEECYRFPNFESAKYVCSPPLRENWHQEALWKGINSGLISAVGSDHSPFMFAGQKTEGLTNFSKIPNGVPGIEDRFSILYHFGVHEKRIPLEKFVDVVSTTPAKLFGISNKGSISIGNDADIVILDPNGSKVITEKSQYQKSDYNLYEGMNLQGAITSVLSRGEVIAKDNKFTGQLGRGRFMHRDKYQNISRLSNKLLVSQG